LSTNAFIDEDFKALSAVCGGSNEPSFLKARSVGFTTSSVAQVDSYLEKNVTP